MPLTNVPAAGGASSLRIPTQSPVTGDIQLIAGAGLSITQDSIGETFTFGASAVSPAAGTGTVTPNATTSGMFAITVTGNLTLNGPANGVDGQRVIFRILNDASHSVTLATGSGNFRFGTDITSYTNSVSLTDYIGAIYNLAALRWDVVSIIQGF